MRDTDKASCTLYVPEGCEEAYSNEMVWGSFGKIVPCLKAGVSSVDSPGGEWRAFPSHGVLIVDMTCEDAVSVYSASGQQVAAVREKGRSEITLPRGVYLVSSRGKTVKVSI